MTSPQRPGSEKLPATSPTSPGRGRWSWRRAAKGAWIVLALLLLVIFVATLPAFFQYARTVCTQPDVGNCPIEQLTPAYVQVLDQLHLSVSAAEGFLAALCVAVSVLFWLLVLFGSSGFLGFNLPAQTPPLFQALAQIISLGLMWPAMLVFFFTFPTGRFTPPWTWAAFVPFFVVTMLSSRYWR